MEIPNTPTTTRLVRPVLDGSALFRHEEIADLEDLSEDDPQERMAKENGWFLTDQFCNPANVRMHVETTAAEILEQTGGRVGAFVAGAGTGGTISGVGRRLKRRLRKTQ